MIEIRRYTKDDKATWNDFVALSKNSTFLFDRNYMDYHRDRFDDCSLMIYKKGRLVALLPANKDRNATLWSHQGLTYGGLIMSARCKTEGVRDMFRQLQGHLYEMGIRHVVYKPVPWIYTRQPAEEDLYAISNVYRAQLTERNVASVIDLSHPLPYSTLRRRMMRRATKEQLMIREESQLGEYWNLLTKNLWDRFHSKPTHSLEEMESLKRMFPQNILLFTVCKENRILGGSLLYDCGRTIKTQYISANEEGKKVGALDLLFDHLIGKYTREGRAFFDFGTSNHPENDDLNETLCFQKEGFGARAICYDTYEWDTDEPRDNFIKND